MDQWRIPEISPSLSMPSEESGKPHAFGVSNHSTHTHLEACVSSGTVCDGILGYGAEIYPAYWQ